MSAGKDLDMGNESIQTKAVVLSIQMDSDLPLVAFDVATMNQVCSVVQAIRVQLEWNIVWISKSAEHFG